MVTPAGTIKGSKVQRPRQPGHGRRARVVVLATMAGALVGCDSQGPADGDAGSPTPPAVPEVCPTLCEKPPCLLAAHRSLPFRIVADGTSIFWTERSLKQPGSVVTMARTGGTPTTLAAGQADPLYLAVDGEALYWGTTGLMSGVMTIPFGGAVWRMGKDGSARTALVSSLIDPVAIAIDADRVYFHALRDNGGPPLSQFGTIHMTSKAGGKAAAVLSEAVGTPLGIAVDDTYLYFTESFPGAIKRAPKRGGAAQMLVAGQSSQWQLAIDGKAIFWGNREPLGGGIGPIMTAAKDGTGVRVVVADDPSFSGEVPALALQGDLVYWVEGGPRGGRVMKVNKDGTGLTVIAADQPGPNGIATDACFVYWTDLDDGSIWGAPR
jgi:hypothetical protein